MVLQNILHSKRCWALAHCLLLLIYTQHDKLRKKRSEPAKFEEENEQKRRVLTGDIGSPGRRPKGNFKAGFSPREKVSIPSWLRVHGYRAACKVEVKEER